MKRRLNTRTQYNKIKITIKRKQKNYEHEKNTRLAKNEISRQFSVTTVKKAAGTAGPAQGKKKQNLLHMRRKEHHCENFKPKFTASKILENIVEIFFKKSLSADKP